MKINCNINGMHLTVSKSTIRKSSDGESLVGYSSSGDIVIIQILDDGYNIEIQSEKLPHYEEVD